MSEWLEREGKHLSFENFLLAALRTLWNQDLSSEEGACTATAGAASLAAAPEPASSSSSCGGGGRVGFEEAFVPLEKFFDDSIQFFDSQRLGGLESHLKKTLKNEIQAVR